MESVKGEGGETHINIVSLPLPFSGSGVYRNNRSKQIKGCIFSKKCRDVEASTYQTKMMIWIR